MGMNLRNTRSGQNSSIGKRSTRNRNGLGSNVHNTSSLASPTASSSSYPGSSHNRQPVSSAAASSSSRRSSTASRTSRKTTRPPAPQQPRPGSEGNDEIILDSITVKADGPEDLDDMRHHPDEIATSTEASLQGESFRFAQHVFEHCEHIVPQNSTSVDETQQLKSAEPTSDPAQASTETANPGATDLLTTDKPPVASIAMVEGPQYSIADHPAPVTLCKSSSYPEPHPVVTLQSTAPALVCETRPVGPEPEFPAAEGILTVKGGSTKPVLDCVPARNELRYPKFVAAERTELQSTHVEATGFVPRESFSTELSTGRDMGDLDRSGDEAVLSTGLAPRDTLGIKEPLSQSPEHAIVDDMNPKDPVMPSQGAIEQGRSRPTLSEIDEAELTSPHGHQSRSSQSDTTPMSQLPQLGDATDLDATDSVGPEAKGARQTPEAETMDFQMDDSSSELSEPLSTVALTTDTAPCDSTPAKSAISHLIGASRNSFASSASALTERSGLSSKPPSVSSKATTPLDTGSPREAPTLFSSVTVPMSMGQLRSALRKRFNVQPKISIPTDLAPQEYAMECIEAAENSRLNPYALNKEEYHMLRHHISHAQVTTYLNIRNGILRLWARNPQIAVTRGEAIGCAKDTRWFDVANVCFDWLVRRGFINYGCVEIRQQKKSSSTKEHSQPRKRRKVVVIGAGFSGLGCARQLEGLFAQYCKRFRDMNEDPPQVVVVEGRNRIGGRVYSRAFETLPDTAPGIFRGKRFTAEMGGMIITGFDRGNPLNILVRGQMGLRYHCLRSDMSLYDTNGTAVDPVRDEMVEHLFNACLDRVSEYKFKSAAAKLIEGNHDLIDEGRDSTAEGHKTIAFEEEKAAAQPHAPPVSQQNVAPETQFVPVSTDRMTGKVHVEPGTPGSTKAAYKAKSFGWNLKAGVTENRNIDLDAAANDPEGTLGSIVDEALMQHKDFLDLSAQDFRLLNWHIANLEYSNATNLNRLSLRGWDIDAGNEWEGKHTMVLGGYQSVARGLSMLPAPLGIRHRAPVKSITYTADRPTGPAKIDLEDGDSIEADIIVNTIPLGVLKHGNIEFDPPLPSWKTDAIKRLGFGVLNKVILIYKEAFWDKDRDIFGMLQTPVNRLSLNQKDYAARRGRFFQWFNVTNTTGMPCLLALMAGDAGYDTEITPNDELIAEATEILRMRYGARVPSQPLEAIVTRWESDRFARGSYSNAGVRMRAEDYEIMARSIGNLHFAGEHTIVTHPATVHGAYLSGLRAASEILDAILGPIEIPTPLILPRETSALLKRKAQEENKNASQIRLEAYEMDIQEYIYAKLGYYPIKPGKVAGNPYLLFNKVYYEEGRRRCDQGRRAGKGKPSPNEVRTMTSKMWKEASAEVRKPFEDAAEEQKRTHAQALKDWAEAAGKWEREALQLREKYVKEHPRVSTPERLATDAASGDWGGRRKKKRVESYAEAESDDADMG